MSVGSHLSGKSVLDMNFPRARNQSSAGSRVDVLFGQAESVKQEPTVVTVSDLLNEAPRSKFHRRAVLISGVGFFTDRMTCSSSARLPPS